MAALFTSLVCSLANLPTPPGITVQGLYFLPFNIDRLKCPGIRDNEVIFNLYTNSSFDTPSVLKIGDDKSISQSNINFKNKLVIFFHGFMETGNSDDAINIRQEYIKKGGYDVIVADNKVLLAGPNYFTGINNVKAIGKHAAKLVDFLVTKGLKLENLHLIGHSLGGQICGVIGQSVTAGKIKWITALDPAGPGFNSNEEKERLDASDAEFVEVIHSNPLLFGYNKPCGTIDFWIHGKSQLFLPGCSPVEVTLRNPGNIAELLFCSHWRSHQTFTYSIRNQQAYPTRKCENYKNYEAGECDSNDLQYMSDAVDKSASGEYYLKIGKKYPYTV